MKTTRRRFLASSGVVLWLPVLESLVPAKVWAQSLSRRKFIAVFTPSGMLMKFHAATDDKAAYTDNGNFTFENALKPVVDAGLKDNLMLLRGLHSTYPQDPHWQNTAGFLSCAPLTLDPQRTLRCAKSFDQYVAEKFPTPLRSAHVGWKPFNRDFTADHPHYADRYLETVAWRAADRPIANTFSPVDLYESLYKGGGQGTPYLRAANARKRSVLDFVLKDFNSVRASLGTDDKARLDAYAQGVRDLEKTIGGMYSGNPALNCQAPAGAPLDVAEYRAHFETMHKLIAQALQCDLISSATIMYDDGVGDTRLLYPGANADHHSHAHLVTGNVRDPEILESINRLHGSLYAHLLTELKSRGQLEQSLVLWGSNMSDGTVHSTDNMPFALAGGGGDLKFGQEVGRMDQPVAKADLFVELAGLYGIDSIKSFGSDILASQGKQLGLRKA